MIHASNLNVAVCSGEQMLFEKYEFERLIEEKIQNYKLCMRIIEFKRKHIHEF